MLIPLTKLDARKKGRSSKLWSTFLEKDKGACEAVWDFFVWPIICLRAYKICFVCNRPLIVVVVVKILL